MNQQHVTDTECPTAHWAPTRASIAADVTLHPAAATTAMNTTHGPVMFPPLQVDCHLPPVLCPRQEVGR
jgi:hypothetical protein